MANVPIFVVAIMFMFVFLQWVVCMSLVKDLKHKAAMYYSAILNEHQKAHGCTGGLIYDEERQRIEHVGRA